MNDNRNTSKDHGRFPVCFRSAAERRKLLDIAESIGIPVGDRKDRKYRHSPGGTDTYVIDLRQKTLQDLPQPTTGDGECGGGLRLYSVSEFARLAEREFKVTPRFPLWHVPHDGREFPEELLSSVCVTREEFTAYHERMRDTEVGRLIPRTYAHASAVEHFDVSRLLCDVERFIGPEEPMERYGMGFCYEKAFDGTKIKDVSEELKERTLRYYRAHHRRMDEKFESHPRALLFDIHSYSDEIVPKEYTADGKRTPDICIGTDPRFTPLALALFAMYRFVEAGFTAELNYPYGGCYVPNAALSGGDGCISVMLEFHKRIYLDEHGGFDEKKSAVIREVIERIIADCVDLGDRADAVRHRLFSEDGTLAYEGSAAECRPLGSGTAYYPDGTVYQEGLFDGKGLLCGREYYPNGQIRFEGIYRHKNGYGPNYPVCGSFFGKEGELLHCGPFRVRFAGSQAYPVIAEPEEYGFVLQREHPRLYGLRPEQMRLRRCNS